MDVSASLEALIARFGERLRRAARRTGLRDQDLDEVVQDVRVRLWKALDSGEKISGVTASYVYSAGRSAAIDLIRRRRDERDQSLTVDSGEEPMFAAAAPTQLDLAVRRDVVERLEAAIDTLDPRRAVAVRMHLAGYAREEIGDLMGWTEPKTRNLIYRGLADLRDRLRQRGITPESVG